MIKAIPARKPHTILYHKCLHNLSALPGDVYFSTQLHSSNTRSGGNRLIIHICYTNTVKRVPSALVAGIVCHCVLSTALRPMLIVLISNLF